MQSFRAVPWSSALVTGASAGIGEEIAKQLASRGVNRIVLVARRADKLTELGASLTARHGTEVEVLAADLCDPAGVRLVEARLADERPDHAVDLLVNNAGFGTAGDFVDLPADEEERQITLNVTALVRLTRAALPGMVARGQGAVMNVSSMATYQPSPGMATYGGTKAFVTQFSEAIYEELRGSGVTVTCVMPGFTRTEFQSHIQEAAYEQAPSFAWTPVDLVARLAVTATAKGKALCIPGPMYQAAAALITPLPRTARRLLIARLQGLPAKLAAREKGSTGSTPVNGSGSASGSEAIEDPVAVPAPVPTPVDRPVERAGERVGDAPPADRTLDATPPALLAANAPVPTGPMVESPTAANPPMVEPKPVEPKPVEPKPVAVKPAEVKPFGSPLGSAGSPVDTPEEADRATILAETLRAKRSSDLSGNAFDPKATIEITPPKNS